MNCRNQFIKWKLSKDQTSDQHFSLCFTEKEPQARRDPLGRRPLSPFPATHPSSASSHALGHNYEYLQWAVPCISPTSWWRRVSLPTQKPGVPDPIECYLLHLNPYVGLGLQREKWFGACLFGGLSFKGVQFALGVCFVFVVHSEVCLLWNMMNLRFRDLIPSSSPNLLWVTWDTCLNLSAL